MFPDFNTYSSPLFVLSIIGIILATFLFKKFLLEKLYKDLFLSLIIMITCYHQIMYTFGFMGWYDTYKTTKINYYLINLSLALAPLIYFYFQAVTNPKKKLTKRDLIHFIPIFLILTIRAVILIYDSNQIGFDKVQNGYLVTKFQWKYLTPISELVSIIQMSVYLALSFQMMFIYKRKINHFFSNTYKLEMNWLLHFLFLYSFLFLYNTFQFFIDMTITNLSWTQTWWHHFFSIIAVIYIAVRAYYTYIPELHGEEIESFLEEKQDNFKKVSNEIGNENSQLSPKIIANKNKIIEYFDQYKPYLEPDLTLVSLSKELNISREDLSEAINRGINLKFNDFINQYRIEEFKVKLYNQKNENISILGIAYECGFNSKATFNRAFKKTNNSSPTEYLRNSLK